MTQPPRPRASAAAPRRPGTAGERIAKVLARAGVASRRAAEVLIAEGRVAVNNVVIDSPALNVTPRDKVTLDGKPLAAKEPVRLWLYHKPAGLVTTERDEKGRQTVFDALPEGMPRVVSVGRLDLNSEGLLLLTNDGELKRRLELPSTGWLRKYRVRVNGRPDEAQLAPLKQGLVVDGERFQPMLVTLDRQQGANAWLTVGLREGKNREIRRAMEAVGLVVNRLIRTSYGPFQLGDLEPGAVEEVRAKVLKDQLGLDAEALEGERSEAPGAPKPRVRPPAALLDAPAGRKSWGMKSHGGARKGPDGEPARPRSWGSKSAGGGASGAKPAPAGDAPRPDRARPDRARPDAPRRGSPPDDPRPPRRPRPA